MSHPRIGYAGMSHLGICSAIGAAERGFEVVAYDAEERRIESLDRAELPVVEPDLPEALARNRRRVHFSSKLQDLGSCDVVFIAQDVPTDEEGGSDLAPIDALLAEVTPAVSARATLVILCQVPPGFTRAHERATGPIHYQVETLIFGRAMERAMHPERFIVGCADPKQELPPAYRAFLEAFDCPILPMRYESAELAKISINVCLVASVSVANTLAELCERIGADWSEIAPALRLDRRIGLHAYLEPGLGIAGGNLERDLTSVVRAAAAAGSDARVVRAFIANSRYRLRWALRAVHTEVLARIEDPVLAVLGLAYKPGTASTKNSPSLALIRDLEPYRMRVYDPVVPLPDSLPPGVQPADSARDACSGADALLIMTPWSEFAELDPRDVAQRLRGRCVIDPYAVLTADACLREGLDYLTLGAPPLRSSPPRRLHA